VHRVGAPPGKEPVGFNSLRDIRGLRRNLYQAEIKRLEETTPFRTLSANCSGSDLPARRALDSSPLRMEPELIPIRMGLARVRASSTISLTLALLRILAGFILTASAPRCNDSRANSGLKWTSATSGMAIPDFIEGMARPLPLKDRNPDNLTSVTFKFLYLGDGACNVLGLRRRHRLDADRGVSTNRNSPDENFLCFSLSYGMLSTTGIR